MQVVVGGEHGPEGGDIDWAGKGKAKSKGSKSGGLKGGVLMRGKLHVEMLGTVFPGESPEGAGI